MTGWTAAVGALIPSVGVGLIFWWAMRAVLRADRSEREALARLDAAASAQEKGSDR